MESTQRTSLAPLFIRLAVLWVAAGALFKLFAGTPADLPPVVRAFPLGLDLTFKSAIAIELLITCAALLRPRTAWPLVVALLLVFEGVLLMVALDGSESCGCFGSSIAIPPAAMMAIDGVLLLLILASRPWNITQAPLASMPTVLATSLISIAAPFLIIGEQEIGISAPGDATVAPAAILDLRYAELHMDTWEGQLIYDIELHTLLPHEIDRVPIDATAVIYRATCDHCAEHLADLAMADDGSRAFILICVPDDEATPENTQVGSMPFGGHVTMLTLPKGPQYLIETPADFQLEGGVVQSVREGIKLP